ncbi:MAG: DEAD/DEAH box helicase family protein [Melioribacteraceae bacterium]|nr:DEAD/DEAH box helicase family protein [Melioribacteraceae bacterium]
MEFSILKQKYEALIQENQVLKSENKKLRIQLGLIEPKKETPKTTTHIANQITSVNKNSQSSLKIKLFLSLFKGRTDVYAKKWISKKGTKGYSPVCLNEWEQGICKKPQIKCSQCNHKLYSKLNKNVIENHLRGNLIIGIYPLLNDDTCSFLAIDFDNRGWQNDITALRKTCDKFNIPIAVERSSSGNGGHIWFFFNNPMPAQQARKFGTSLLTSAMNQRHEIKFNSYDRLFPYQDRMPQGGFGNLIALPLQKEARKISNTLFVDDNFEAYTDQWMFLNNVKKISVDEVELYIKKFNIGNELGQLRISEDEEEAKPWNSKQHKLAKSDFPQKIKYVKANMLYILKVGISQKGLNSIKRLAAFKNPEFYKAQAMRLSTFNKPRIISCSDESENFLLIPRGCETELNNLLSSCKVDFRKTTETKKGKKINVSFNGILRDEQKLAFNELIRYNDGVLSATTAFGKTVIAAKLITHHKVNTLILVHRKQLLFQWMKRLSEFINFEEKIIKGKTENDIGQFGGGKDNRTGIVDVAIFQSVNRSGEIKKFVSEYGMVIVDECHHVSAFSFEQTLQKVNAKYIYGLTATPTRKDGHHPIIFMYCGPIRYKVDAKKQAEKSPFEYFIIPKFTRFKAPIDWDEKSVSIQELYSEIVNNEARNQQIVNDVIESYQKGRNSLILTERTAHVKLLAKKIKATIPNTIILTGTLGTKAMREILKLISETPKNEQVTIIATGKYIGEGFDEPRLDTLFLVMPISWKGTLQQYAGRLNRLYETKKEVQIFDYVDIHVKMFQRMYEKRLSGYASLGYKIKGEGLSTKSIDVIFNQLNFLPVFNDDIISSGKEIFIVSPFLSKYRISKIIQILNVVIKRNIHITILTRPSEDFGNRNKNNFKENRNLEQLFEELIKIGVNLKFKSNIHQKFAIIDNRIVWYGSINLLSFGKSEESIMRLDSSNIANELLDSING